ncbi:MAG: type II toxin-antitoxin system RelE/ParE family toxin [Myxococcota bacterium]
MKRILWSPRAIRDLEAIRNYIALDSPAYGALIVERLVRAPERLQEFPESGRIVPERGDPRLRELIVRPFRIVYRLRGDAVEIVTVFRATRIFPDVPE